MHTIRRDLRKFTIASQLSLLHDAPQTTGRELLLCANITQLCPLVTALSSPHVRSIRMIAHFLTLIAVGTDVANYRHRS